MRHVRRVEPTERVPAEPQLLAIGERARRPIGVVVDRYHRRDTAADRHCLGRRGKEGIERAALIRLEVRQTDVAQTPDRNDGLDRLTHEREQMPMAGMEHHGLIVDDQILVEAELAAAGQLHRSVDAVDALGHLLDVRAGLRIGDHVDLRREYGQR